MARGLERNDLFAYNSQKSEQERQESEDSKISHALTVQTMRAEHRRIQFKKMIGGAKESATVADMWRECDPEIDDVMNGICISMLLPNIKNLEVKINKKKIVTVEAIRQIQAGDRESSAADSTFDIDFEVDGDPVVITQKELSYEYASESGMLHVYIENVHLEEDDNECKGDVLQKISNIKSKFSKVFSGIKRYSKSRQ